MTNSFLIGPSESRQLRFEDQVLPVPEDHRWGETTLDQQPIREFTGVVYDREHDVQVVPNAVDGWTMARYWSEDADGTRTPQLVYFPNSEVAVFRAKGRHDDNMVKVISPFNLTESYYSEPDARDWRPYSRVTRKAWDGWHDESTPLRVIDRARAYDEAAAVDEHEVALKEARARVARATAALEVAFPAIDDLVDAEASSPVLKALLAERIEAFGEQRQALYGRERALVQHRIETGVVQETAIIGVWRVESRKSSQEYADIDSLRGLEAAEHEAELAAELAWAESNAVEEEVDGRVVVGGDEEGDRSGAGDGDQHDDEPDGDHPAVERTDDQADVETEETDDDKVRLHSSSLQQLAS